MDRGAHFIAQLLVQVWDVIEKLALSEAPTDEAHAHEISKSRWQHGRGVPWNVEPFVEDIQNVSPANHRQDGLAETFVWRNIWGHLCLTV